MTDTRERILHAAFSALTESHYTGLSLSRIAEIAGITKPAIYRHYADKDELIFAMYEHFYDEFAAALPVVDKGMETSAIERIQGYSLIRFFSLHPEYLGFFLYSLIAKKGFETELFRELHERRVFRSFEGHPLSCGVPGESSAPEGSMNGPVPEDIRSVIAYYLRIIFGAVTCIHFIFELHSVATQSNSSGTNLRNHQIDIGIFTDRLWQLLAEGWEIPGWDLSVERMNELELLSTVSDAELPEESRIFSAVASVIKEYGFPGTTVERIAEKMGLAKSSLYSYFRNKNELLSELVYSELSEFVQIVERRRRLTNTLPEAVYMHLMTVTSYLQKRPSIIPVFSWLRSRGNLRNSEIGHYIRNDRKIDITNTLNTFPGFRIPDLGIPLKEETVSIWISAIPISVLIQCRFHKFTDEQVVSAMRMVYSFIGHGVEENN
ncbi:MAG: TetR/AcrR family transcriptional regulator [Spirochaetaceae bacterium]|jgi:AcrR family transcriptional regulator|nr:TetR/AcrR family transcriptional regulator [Spirochaetaceae bacterium]